MRAGFPPAERGMVIGLLGGSFDPAHEGHVHITEQAMARMGLDQVWWLVTPGNPLKARQPAPMAERPGAIVVMLQDRDAKTAEEIILDDDKLDALHHKTFDLALSDKWTGSRQQLIDVVLLGRFMERLGDHAVSASRRVVYIVSGFDPSKEPSRDEDGAVE